MALHARLFLLVFTCCALDGVLCIRVLEKNRTEFEKRLQRFQGGSSAGGKSAARSSPIISTPQPTPRTIHQEFRDKFAEKEAAEKQKELEEQQEKEKARKAKLDALVDQLDSLVGLDSVKAEMRRLMKQLEFDRQRKRLGLPSIGGQSLHMAFLGNPGTGKTVVARIVGQLLEAMGVIEAKEPQEKKSSLCPGICQNTGFPEACWVHAKRICETCDECRKDKGKNQDEISKDSVFVEVGRADLVAEYVGHTAPRVQNAVKSALGGVLFIDEAYALKRDEQDSFGQEAIDTLIKEMEDRRSEVIVILAGYDNEMTRFFQANPGFRSRVPFTFNFDDYTCRELMQIAELQMRSAHVQLSFNPKHLQSPCFPDNGKPADACTPLKAAVQFSSGCCETPDGCGDTGRAGGNGRAVRNLLEGSMRHMAQRVLQQLSSGALDNFNESLTRGSSGLPAADFINEAKQAERQCGSRSKFEKANAIGFNRADLTAAADLRCAFLEMQGSDILAQTSADAQQALEKQCYENDEALTVYMRTSDVVALGPRIASLQARLQRGTSGCSEVQEEILSLRRSGATEAEQPKPSGAERLLRTRADSQEAEEEESSARAQVNALLREFAGLIGLEGIKHGVADLRDTVEFNLWRQSFFPHFKSLLGQSFHMQFLGNPGTGKTVVARIVGQLLVALGAISTRRSGDDGELDADSILHEASRVDLVGEHVGATAQKVQRQVQAALGGVLFVDEAYAIKQADQDAFGQEAVDTLIKEMEDRRAEVIVIFAGYEKEMRLFFESNPGFSSRVPFTFRFPDYDCRELLQIADLQLKGKQMRLADHFWLDRSIQIATSCCTPDEVAAGTCKDGGRDNGNGRAVRNLLESGFRYKAEDSVIGMPPELLESMRPLKAPGSAKWAFQRLETTACELPEFQEKHKLELTGVCDFLQSMGNEQFVGVARDAVLEKVRGLCPDLEHSLTQKWRALEAGGSQETWNTLKQAFRSKSCTMVGSVLDDTPDLGEDMSRFRSSRSMENLPESVEKVFADLDEMVGLAQIKQSMRQLYMQVTFNNWRMQLKLKPLAGQSFHMQFVGNPGTGKTVVARIVGELLRASDAISEPTVDDGKPSPNKTDEAEADASFNFVEASRADLVAKYVGQTAPKVKKMVQQALGGVLFIDEAYALKQDDKDSFGQEAVDTLIKEMEDHRAHVVVIVAGYRNEMAKFFESNPGFKSRVPFTFHFQDYTCSELVEIGGLHLRKRELEYADESAKDAFYNAIRATSGCCEELPCPTNNVRSKGNGRAVRNFLEGATRVMASRSMKVMKSEVWGDCDYKCFDKQVALVSRFEAGDFIQTLEEATTARLARVCSKQGELRSIGNNFKTGSLAYSFGQLGESRLEELLSDINDLSHINVPSKSLGSLKRTCDEGVEWLKGVVKGQLERLCSSSMPDGFESLLRLPPAGRTDVAKRLVSALLDDANDAAMLLHIAQGEPGTLANAVSEALKESCRKAVQPVIRGEWALQHLRSVDVTLEHVNDADDDVIKPAKIRSGPNGMKDSESIELYKAESEFVNISPGKVEEIWEQSKVRCCCDSSDGWEWNVKRSNQCFLLTPIQLKKGSSCPSVGHLPDGTRLSDKRQTHFAPKTSSGTCNVSRKGSKIILGNVGLDSEAVLDGHSV